MKNQVVFNTSHDFARPGRGQKPAASPVNAHLQALNPLEEMARFLSDDC